MQTEAADAALAAARAELEAAAREDISPSRAQAAQKRIAALEAECGRQQVRRTQYQEYVLLLSFTSAVPGNCLKPAVSLRIINGERRVEIFITPTGIFQLTGV